MQRLRVLLTAALIGAVATVSLAEERTDGALAGRVTAATQPLSTARVYAYKTADLQLRKVLTDRQGVFLFDSLPAGLYKIIALKPGFLPAVVMLSRTTAGATQFLEVELSQEPSDPRASEASFWRIREKIPADVLRDLDQPMMVAQNAAGSEADRSLTTKMQASSGVHDTLDAGEAQVNVAQVGVEGQIRQVGIDFSGRFSELESQGFGGEQPTGATQAMTLEIEPTDRARLAVSSHSNTLTTFDGATPSNVDFERHLVSWSQAIGKRGQSDFSAQYTEESNYYRQALISPNWIPTASRAWRLEGSYSTTLGSRSTLEAGVRYRDRSSEYAKLRRGQPTLPSESVELFGRAGLEVNPTIVVQYGLYSAMRDGNLSLAPQGGFILNLGRNWKASTLLSHRLDEQVERRLPLTDFTPSYLEDGRNCREDAIYCYEIEVERARGADDRMSFAAAHRKIGDTQRLFFDGDFLDRFDSLYLVEGDQLPELRFELTKRLAPEVVATVSSNIATGGGGLLQTTGRRRYENDVSYLVTSVDTRFEETSTGVFLAFHRLEQDLIPLKGRRAAPGLELERLRFGVTQDLDVLRHLASELALHVNMELSRGNSSDTSVLALEDLRRRITGGVAVRF